MGVISHAATVEKFGQGAAWLTIPKRALGSYQPCFTVFGPRIRSPLYEKDGSDEQAKVSPSFVKDACGSSPKGARNTVTLS
eukprot:scaffold451_cov184-Amphora_coffeaeformis.AAC.11